MRSFGPVPHLETNQGQKLIEDEFLIKEKSHSSIGEMERIKNSTKECNICCTSHPPLSLKQKALGEAFELKMTEFCAVVVRDLRVQFLLSIMEMEIFCNPAISSQRQQENTECEDIAISLASELLAAAYYENMRREQDRTHRKPFLCRGRI